MKRFLTVVALAVTLAGAPVVAQDTQAPVALSRVQAIQIAQQALREGKPQIAAEVSAALLRADPEDAEALMIKAILMRGTGRLDDARDASSQAYRHATAPGLKFEAAMLTADVLARQEKFTRAEFWLRRADQTAPDEARRSLAERAFQAVDRRNPLQVSLRFSIKPSNNVNNGAETTIIEIGGLPFRLDDTGQQLGGWEASAGVSLSYRLSMSERHQTDLLGELSFRKVWLDSDASELAPDARDSDFDYGAILAGVRHRRLIWPETGPSEITGVIGQSWYGGDALARWTELRLGQTVRRSETSALRFTVSGRIEKRLDADINDSEALAVSAEYLRGLSNGRGYSVGANARTIWSDSATVDSLVLGVNGSWSFERIGPVESRIGLSAETRDYRKWRSTPGGREDNTLSLRADVIWPEVSYYGFVPQATLTARRTWSDVDIYDRNEVSLGLTAVSRF